MIHTQFLNLTTVEALNKILENIVPTESIVEKSIAECSNDICAQDLVSPFDVPAFNNAAMDGFAFHLFEEDHVDGLTLNVIGEAKAGHPFREKLSKGQAIRIMTGAPVPDECNCVIAHEKTSFTETSVSFDATSLREGDNIRYQGEELRKGQVAFHKNQKIDPFAIGLAATLGYAKLKVFKKPHVAIFATGDELVCPGNTLKNGQIYNSNGYLLSALCESWGCQVSNLGILPDQPENLKESIAKALQSHDFIVTSGGVGEGKADFIDQVIAHFGNVEHWFIAMRPGRPMSFGLIGDQQIPFLALPGNPVAAANSAMHFLRPALLRMQNAENLSTNTVTLKTSGKFKTRLGRTDYVRGTTCLDPEGQTRFKPHPRQGSAMLSTLTESNAIAIVPSEMNDVSDSAQIQVEYLSELLR